MKNTQKLYWLAMVLLLLLGVALPTGGSRAATTGFRVSGKNLLDANGNNFIMRGINHAHAWYSGQTSSFANIKATGANTIRVVIQGGARWGKNSVSDVANVVSLCKTNKLICVLENHDTTGYGEDGTAVSLATSVNYWKEIQSALTGQEAYVIINIGNEPYGNNNYTNWVSETKNAIAAMRTAGFKHTLMIDAPNWGQDWSFTMRDNAASVFNSDPEKNIIFSVHMYGVYDTAAEIKSYMDAFATANLPLLVGEFGFNHSDGNPDEDTIMAEAQARGLGYLAWSWSGNGGGVEYLDMVTSFDPTKLTTWGTRAINGANGIKTTSKQASVYGGILPTTVPTTAPTSGPTTVATATKVPATTTPGAVKVLLAADGGDNNQQSGFQFKVQNTSSSAISSISLRIYFTLDGTQPASNYIIEKYWDQSGAATVSGPTLASGSIYYFTINFGGASLPANGIWEFHGNLHLKNWATSYVGTNDWWHGTGSLPTAYTSWSKIPVYINNTLAWGAQP